MKALIFISIIITASIILGIILDCKTCGQYFRSKILVAHSAGACIFLFLVLISLGLDSPLAAFIFGILYIVFAGICVDEYKKTEGKLD